LYRVPLRSLKGDTPSFCSVSGPLQCRLVVGKGGRIRFISSMIYGFYHLLRPRFLVAIFFSPLVTSGFLSGGAPPGAFFEFRSILAPCSVTISDFHESITFGPPSPLFSLPTYFSFFQCLLYFHSVLRVNVYSFCPDFTLRVSGV